MQSAISTLRLRIDKRHGTEQSQRESGTSTIAAEILVKTDKADIS